MANIKFSQFTAEADINNFDDIVGYAGAVNTRITPANLASSLITLSGGPYLPLTAGPTVPLTGDLNLAATNPAATSGSQALVFNGVDDGNNPVVAAKIFTVDSSAAPSGQDLSIDVADDNGVLQNYLYIDAFGQVGVNTNAPGFTLDVSGSGRYSGAVVFNSDVTLSDDVKDLNNFPGNVGQVLVSKGGGGAGVQWVNAYKSIQSFVWTNGSPVAYVNFPPPPGTLPTNSGLPFDPTPLVDYNNLPGGVTASDYNWTCTNAAGGDAGQIATFTLGASAPDGVWRVSTANHWFDQNSFIEVIVEFVINGTGIQVTDERSNDGAGDKIYYGELYQEFSAGDTLQVFVTFQNSSTPATTPFPSAAGNRPIEVNFERIV